MRVLMLCALVFLLPVPTLWAEEFRVKSEAFGNDQVLQEQYIYDGFGCKGANKSPQLSWTKGPAGTQYYAVTVYDPDAPTGSGWWHWAVVNIPQTTTELKQGASGSKDALPQGSFETRTDFGKVGYGGPCPPAGDSAHRYVFTVYALKDKVPVDKDASGAMVGFYLNALKLAEAKITGKYQR
jgi:hypothetical protein